MTGKGEPAAAEVATEDVVAVTVLAKAVALTRSSSFSLQAAITSLVHSSSISLGRRLRRPRASVWRRESSLSLSKCILS